MNDPLFMKEWPEDTDVPWRLKGRKSLNKIIRRFNEWMKNAMVQETYDLKEAKHMMAKIEEGKQTWADQDGGWDWVKDLNTMADYIKSVQQTGV